MTFHIPRFLVRDRALGVAQKHTYDIPLDQGSGRIFLTLLIGLMVFLASLSITGAFALTQFADRWQTGLEGHWTIELPAIDSKGQLIEPSTLQADAERVKMEMMGFTTIDTVDILSEKDVRALLEPWFDFDDIETNAMPLPLLISLTMKKTTEETAQAITEALDRTVPGARLDRHEEWLDQLLNLTTTLRMIAVIFTLIICGAAITAVAGAIQSRMAEHKESVQLLHLMGASDIYIMRQFQRHGIVMALQGGLAGLSAAGVMMFIFSSYMSGNLSSQLPELRMTTDIILALLCLPLMAAGLAALTTRFTVLHTLNRMP